MGWNGLKGRGVDRRGFLRITAAAAGMGAAAWAVGGLPGRRRGFRLEESRLIMGTVANLTVLTGHEPQGREALAATFDRMEQLEAVLTRFRPESDLSRLNRLGEIRNPHPALLKVVGRSLYYSRATDGAFDPTIEPLLAAYRRHASGGRSPTDHEREALLSSVDYRAVRVGADSIGFERPGMAITLDGIAKGFVIDEGTRQLRDLGFHQILVEVGGDLVGGNRAGDPWRVGLRSPRREDGREWVGVAHVADRALATSGDYMNAFTADYRLHHILDPRRGESPAELASVSVLAASALDADALSTAVLVLGARRGMELVEGLAGVEALLIDKHRGIRRSSGFPLESA